MHGFRKHYPLFSFSMIFWSANSSAYNYRKQCGRGVRSQSGGRGRGEFQTSGSCFCYLERVERRCWSMGSDTSTFCSGAFACPVPLPRPAFQSPTQEGRRVVSNSVSVNSGISMALSFRLVDSRCLVGFQRDCSIFRVN